ncbi:sensor histidine kinase [Micromonosporaceae bacterium Da 78-11]
MWRGRSARSWLLEISLAVPAMLLGFFFLIQSVSEGDGAAPAVETGAAALSFAGLVLFRRSRPVALTSVLIPFGIVLAMPMGATPVALFAVALHRPPRVAVALAALHAVLVSVIYGFALGLTRTYYETVAFLVLLHVSLVAIALLVRSQRLLVRSWADRAMQAEDGQRLRIDRARAAERERIAREMHDVLAHRISLLAVHAGALAVRRDAPPAERQAAEVIRVCAHDALEDLRSVIGMLRTPAEDRPQPTLGDVAALVEQSRSTGTQVGLSDAGLELPDGHAVPDQVGRHAYRIIQEALTNARKHAPGAPVRVEISGCVERGLHVQIGNPLTHGSPTLANANHHDPHRPAPSHAALHGSDLHGSDLHGSDLHRSDLHQSNSHESDPQRAGLHQLDPHRPGHDGVDVAGASYDGAMPGAGAGLVGLRERVSLVGGRLEHGPTAAGEFHLRAWLPWQP